MFMPNRNAHLGAIYASVGITASHGGSNDKASTALQHVRHSGSCPNNAIEFVLAPTLTC
jgi:hypothetical protein